MLNDPMDQVSRRTPALPESLRQAVREAEATGRAAEERAQSAMPFRARLRARDAIRPQPTLSILTHSGPITAGPVNRLAVSEVRVLEKPRTPGRPATKAPLIPIAATAGGIPVTQKGGAGSDDDDERTGLFARLGDFSQFAFAGLAVLGLAGLSVMAAENALGSKSDDAEGDVTTAGLDPAPQAASVSAAAVELASTPVDAAPTPWFDYKGTADLLKSRIAELDAAEKEAVRQAALDADRSAAAAIANAEAARVAAQPKETSSGPAVIDARVRDQLATEEAMRTANAEAANKLKLEQQAAAAKAEADRLAAEEAARAAAAAAEQKRLAEVEAQRAADAEAKRLADLAAKQKAAEAEAKRLADAAAAKAAQDAEAKRLADLEVKRKADAEAKRLADLAAKQKAADAEAKRLADAEAKRLAAVEAKRLADAEKAAAAAATVSVAATPTPRVWSKPPGRASLKPARPAAPTELAAIDSAPLADPVTRTAPPSLSATPPVVRAFGARPVDDFIAERAEYTAGHSLEAPALDVLKSDFLRLVETSADGTHHQLLTPDGRPLLIHFERTVPVDPVTASIQAIGYNPAAEGSVTRGYLEPVDVNVRVMCRDVAYAFPGQERGRFAACESEAGVWTMHRASTTNGKPI